MQCKRDVLKAAISLITHLQQQNGVLVHALRTIAGLDAADGASAGAPGAPPSASAPSSSASADWPAAAGQLTAAQHSVANALNVVNLRGALAATQVTAGAGLLAAAIKTVAGAAEAWGRAGGGRGGGAIIPSAGDRANCVPAAPAHSRPEPRASPSSVTGSAGMAAAAAAAAAAPPGQGARATTPQPPPPAAPTVGGAAGTPGAAATTAVTTNAVRGVAATVATEVSNNPAEETASQRPAAAVAAVARPLKRPAPPFAPVATDAAAWSRR
jgi:hypothetical protein